MAQMQRTISPVDGSVYVERPLASAGEAAAMLAGARRAFGEWRRVPVAARAAICTRAVDALVARTAEIAPEISWQMGRPASQSPREVRGFEERARYMIGIAAAALADLEVAAKDGFTRLIRREPLGVVFTIAPWNYPYLT